MSYHAQGADHSTRAQVLYSQDVLSDQAIIYWHSKGAKPQAKQHFLTATQPLVNFLKEQEEESDEDEE